MANLYVTAVPTADLNRNTKWFMYPGNASLFRSLITFSTGRKEPHLPKTRGIYNRLTWWEQIDKGKQLTRNRKFLTVVPVVLYLIASHTTDYQHPMLIFNTLAVMVLVVAKFPNMHKVRIFGINADK
ncbi:hypothetical protein Peur_048232 [Populus x canadensis]